jgi:Zn-dependent protease with chaperone function
MRWFYSLTSAMIFLALLAPPANAAGSPARATRNSKDEQPIVDGIAAIDPALATQFREATAALDGSRLEQARAGFQAVLARIPQHAASLRRLSYVEAGQNHPAQAITRARQALAAEPGADGRTALVMALLGAKDPSLYPEASDLAAAAYREKPSEQTAGLLAELALRHNDPIELRNAVTALDERAPDGIAANYFGALLHLVHNEPQEAERRLQRAALAGMPPEAIAQIREQSGLSATMRTWWYAELAGLGLLAWVVGLALLFVTGLVLSRATLAAIEKAAGNPQELARRTARLRGLYAKVIAIAAAYYYLSIPVVIAVVLAGAGGIIYGFLLLGHIPIKLVVLLAIGALASVWAMLRSLIASRAKQEDPGRRLTEAEAPALWAVLRDVAARVGTRPVDAVFLTPGTDIAVSERGPLRARLVDRGERILILGAGVLAGFSQASLRAVLAHEYGHFSHRDTAGGRLAGAVLAALFRTVLALAQGGGALFLNPAWHFLRFFHALFTRITHGASRLQEVLADQCAALAFGPSAFADGLTHVIRRSIEFHHSTHYLVTRAEKDRKALANLYTLPADADLPRDDMAKAIEQALADAGSPYDSHPPPSLRLKWVARLPEPESGAGARSTDDAWALFASRESLEADMTSLVNTQLESAGIISEEAAASPG